MLTFLDHEIRRKGSSSEARLSKQYKEGLRDGDECIEIVSFVRGGSGVEPNGYCKTGSASQVDWLLAVAPVVSKWMVPGSSLQKLLMPAIPTVSGVAVTR